MIETAYFGEHRAVDVTALVESRLPLVIDTATQDPC